MQAHVPALALLVLVPHAAAQTSHRLPAHAPARAPQGPPPYEASGVLRPVGGLLSCLALEADDGTLLALADESGLVEGERVWVSGHVDGVRLCGSLIVEQLVARVEPAFAGTGTIVADGPHLGLATDDGTYALADAYDYPVGSAVYVQGIAREIVQAGTPRVEITPRAIGPAFAGFGRLAQTGGGWRLVTPSATYELEQNGAAFSGDGAFVFVEGWLETVDGLPLVRDNTTRPAHELAGQVVDWGDGTLAFQAEGLLFDDVFRIADLGGFGLGERLFVRARTLDDYDPLEPRVEPLLREASVDPEFTACGTLDFAGDEVVFTSIAGPSFELEHAGPHGEGELVYVSGAIDLATSSYLHNWIAPCSELSGTLQHGFECTPVFVADSGDVLMLENLGGHGIDDWFCTLGGVAACTVFCPLPCHVGNTLSDCTK